MPSRKRNREGQRAGRTNTAQQQETGAERFVRGLLAIDQLPRVLETLEEAIEEVNGLRATAQVSLDRPSDAKPGTFLAKAPRLALLCAIRDSMPSDVPARANLTETIDAYRHFRGRTAITAGLNAACAQVTYLFHRFYQAETERLAGLAQSQAAKDIAALDELALDVITIQRILGIRVDSFALPSVEDAILDPAKLEQTRAVIAAAKAAVDEPYMVHGIKEMRSLMIRETAARRSQEHPSNAEAWAKEMRLRIATATGRLAKAGIKSEYAVVLSPKPDELELAGLEPIVAAFEADALQLIEGVIVDLDAKRQSEAYQARMAESQLRAKQAREAVVPLHEQPLEAREAAVIAAFLKRNSVLTPFTRLMAPEGIEILTRSESVIGPGQPRVQAEVEISCLCARVPSAKVTLPEGAYVAKGFAGRVHAPARPAQSATAA